MGDTDRRWPETASFHSVSFNLLLSFSSSNLSLLCRNTAGLDARCLLFCVRNIEVMSQNPLHPKYFEQAPEMYLFLDFSLVGYVVNNHFAYSFICQFEEQNFSPHFQEYVVAICVYIIYSFILVDF